MFTILISLRFLVNGVFFPLVHRSVTYKIHTQNTTLGSDTAKKRRRRRIIYCSRVWTTIWQQIPWAYKNKIHTVDRRNGQLIFDWMKLGRIIERPLNEFFFVKVFPLKFTRPFFLVGSMHVQITLKTSKLQTKNRTEIIKNT